MPCHAPSSLLFAPRSVTWQVFPEQRHCGLAELRARAARRLERRSGAAGFDDLAAVTTKGRRDAGREDASERTGGGGQGPPEGSKAVHPAILEFGVLY